MSAARLKLVVSIHAPRCRGAMRRLWAWRLWAWSFQSTLPVAGERCTERHYSTAALTLFQSTLPVAGERCTLDDQLGLMVGWVSIHARRCRGAMLRRFSGWAAKLKCFNPRSPLPGSDAAPVLGLGGKAKMFQSTLPVAGERCDYGSSNLRCSSVFQSTLPVAGERCYSHHQLRPSERRVSIHAPRCRGAMPAWLSSSSDLTATFQSTLPVAGERCMAAGSLLASMS